MIEMHKAGIHGLLQEEASTTQHTREYIRIDSQHCRVRVEIHTH